MIGKETLFLIQHTYKRFLIITLAYCLLGLMLYTQGIHGERLVATLWNGSSLQELKQPLYSFPLFWLVFYFFQWLIIHNQFKQAEQQRVPLLSVLPYSRGKIISAQLLWLMAMTAGYHLVIFALLYVLGCLTSGMVPFLVLLLVTSLWLNLLLFTLQLKWNYLFIIFLLVSVLVCTSRFFIGHNPFNATLYSRRLEGLMIENICVTVGLITATFIGVIYYFRHKDIIDEKERD